MKISNYVDMFRNIGKEVPIWNSVFLILKELTDRDLDRLAQRACVKLGHPIEEDGIIGKNTITAIFRCDPIQYLTVIGRLVSDKSSVKEVEENTSLEDTIMMYLAKAEGLHLHWNKTERDFTTMYGIYAYSFPNSVPVKYVRKLAKSKNIPLNRRNIRRLDLAISPVERAYLTKIIFEFYQANFMDTRINTMIGKKSSLSFFSNSVNGGMVRGYKSLQSAIKTDVDGKFGKASFMRLENCKLTDAELNQSMGDYMYWFYKRLARKRKFRIYLKGWINRLLGLGWTRK